MTHQNKLKFIKDAGISTMFVILSICFSGLCEPFLPVLCGMACAITLTHFNIRLRCFFFLLIICVSFLETRIWFLEKSAITFGLSGLAVTCACQKFPLLARINLLVRTIKIIPAILVIMMMPITASLFSAKSPKRGMINGGVWATIGKLPKGQEALSTKHQYTYEKFKDGLGAEVTRTDQPLEEYDELILITPTYPFDAKSTKTLRDWTAKGGRLFVVADHTNLFGHQTVLKDLLEEFNISIQPDALFETETNGGIYSNFFGKYVGMTPCSISSGVIPRLKMRGFSEYPDYTASSFFGEMSPSNEDKWSRHVVMGSKRFGLGEISVFSDSTFFANFAINRWSSQAIVSSVFWNRNAAILSLVGLISLLFYLKKPNDFLLSSATVLILLCPSLGFNPSLPKLSTVSLRPPDSVSNDSEERDKGIGSALFASAYAFDVEIKWDKNANQTFREHIETNGIRLDSSKNVAESEKWKDVPSFDVQEIVKNKFYVDENSFWFSQGAGLLRTANMENCWKLLGASIPQASKISVVGTEMKKLRQSEISATHKITYLNDNWVIFDDRIIGRWVPKASKWLIRREWQLGPWLKNDIILEDAP